MQGKQIRAARAMLGWSLTDLAQKSKIGTTTLKRYESGGVTSGLPEYIFILRGIFEKEGILFVENSSDGYGIFYKD